MDWIEAVDIDDIEDVRMATALAHVKKTQGF